MIPLVSSLCYGPIEICQLPRTWWKTTLNAVGLLDEEYPECSGGLDSAVLDRLGLDKEGTLAHIHAERPDYLAFEAWVRDKTGGGPSEAVRQEWNSAIRERIHRAEKIESITPLVGLRPEDGVTSAVVLNHLEDWHYWVERDLRGEGIAAWKGKVVPLVSSLDIGPLGLIQLARTWHKVLLEAEGLLHPDYPGCGGGLDRRVIEEALGLTTDEVIAHLGDAKPGYLDFEGWCRDRMADPDRFEERKVAFNASVVERLHKPEKRADIHNNLERADDGSLPPGGVVLNHVEDWHYAHRALVRGA